MVDIREQLDTIIILQQQALLDDLSHILRGQFHSIGKPGLNLREIVALLLAHVTHNTGHLFLCGDDHPGTSPTFRRQAFCDSLQVGHELDVIGDILADLVNEEVETELR